MNRIQFGQGGCEKTLRYLDAYINNELTVETNHDVVRHLDACAACSEELDARTRMRSRLKAAVKAQSVPPDLQVRIREQIGSSDSGNWFKLEWFRAGRLRQDSALPRRLSQQ